MEDREVVWLHGEVKTPPFSREARSDVGFLLRRLQQGELLSMPHSRPMPSIGAGCHELRVRDHDISWRVIYRIDEDAVIVAEVFAKKTSSIPLDKIRNCVQRLADYDST